MFLFTLQYLLFKLPVDWVTICKWPVDWVTLCKWPVDWVIICKLPVDCVILCKSPVDWVILCKSLVEFEVGHSSGGSGSKRSRISHVSWEISPSSIPKSKTISTIK